MCQVMTFAEYFDGLTADQYREFFHLFEVDESLQENIFGHIMAASALVDHPITQSSS